VAVVCALHHLATGGLQLVAVSDDPLMIPADLLERALVVATFRAAGFLAVSVSACWPLARRRIWPLFQFRQPGEARQLCRRAPGDGDKAPKPCRQSVSQPWPCQPADLSIGRAGICAHLTVIEPEIVAANGRAFRDERLVLKGAAAVRGAVRDRFATPHGTVVALITVTTIDPAQFRVTITAPA